MACTSAACALDASNVLVLYNNDSPDGLQIAQYYEQTHPGVSLLGLDGVSTEEQITQNQYLNVIRPQVLAALNDNIDCIVTTKGLPLRIKNTQQNPGTYDGWRGSVFGVPLLNEWWAPYSSLESELTRITLIDSADKMGDQAYFISPPTFPFDTPHQADNPYYNTNQAFDHTTPGYDGMRLTARLDGFTVDDVIESIDRAQKAYHVLDQQIVIVDDDPDAPATNVDRMASLANSVLKPDGQLMVYDNSRANITDAPYPVIGYVSHGSHAAESGYIDDLDFDLANGAVFQTWESYNAYSFQPGGERYGQGLIAEWIAEGGTAGLGQVEEPGASAANVANEDVLWSMLLQGYTFAEAAWAATPQLSYVNTVVGDPLMTLLPWVPGDTNQDGLVGLDDLAKILDEWNQFVDGGIYDGDFSRDGYIGLDDLGLMLSNWDESQTSHATGSTTPEPATLTLLTFGCLWLRSRR